MWKNRIECNQNHIISHRRIGFQESQESLPLSTRETKKQVTTWQSLTPKRTGSNTFCPLLLSSFSTFSHTHLLIVWCVLMCHHWWRVHYILGGNTPIPFTQGRRARVTCFFPSSDDRRMMITVRVHPFVTQNMNKREEETSNPRTFTPDHPGEIGRNQEHKKGRTHPSSPHIVIGLYHEFSISNLVFLLSSIWSMEKRFASLELDHR